MIFHFYLFSKLHIISDDCRECWKNQINLFNRKKSCFFPTLLLNCFVLVYYVIYIHIQCTIKINHISWCRICGPLSYSYMKLNTTWIWLKFCLMCTLYAKVCLLCCLWHCTMLFCKLLTLFYNFQESDTFFGEALAKWVELNCTQHFG